MTEPYRSNPFADAVVLLERATCYVLGTASAITVAALDHATPCTAWNLRTLLAHVNESLAIVAETLAPARTGEAFGCENITASPLAVLQHRAGLLLETCLQHPSRVRIEGWPLDGKIATATGALEIAVHGWDIAQTCGHDTMIPDGLAAALLRIAPLLVTDATRPSLFAPPVACSRQAEPGERLVAYLGRYPGHRR
ncbi:TIGR03086 family metal-binding protein [Saccharopolyspora phatthalungensis]|uniref:Uncharacterized protein (TIGR03086 family) n=1 Tax=Saccharopolyspora phatthalungensis TaxID=664693 RepID=A0A840QHY8_9PSEU|nr:TIGR03086 family metal-binding protein [Saccharopolyspora phatthalungensis]MBB5158428.1 uncharacterized protein (TIGR03086 family) [Saccharopolyspora phatthalungensis]